MRSSAVSGSISILTTCAPAANARRGSGRRSAGLLQARLDALRQPVRLQVGDPADLGEAERGPLVPLDEDLPAGQGQLLGLGVQQARGQAQRTVPDRLAGQPGRSPADDRLPGGERAEPPQRLVGVTDAHLDGVVADPDRVGDDLRDRGLQSLALGGHAAEGGDGAVRVDPYRACLVAGAERHPRPGRGGPAQPGQLVVAGEADAEPRLAVRDAPSLLGAVGLLVEAGQLDRLVQAGRVVPGVVDQPGRHPVGNVFRPDEVAAADLLAAEIQRAGRRVDHRLHGEDTGRAGDAPIRTGGRGVRRHAAYRAVMDCPSR